MLVDAGPFVSEQTHRAVDCNVAVKLRVAEIVNPSQVSSGGDKYLDSVGPHAGYRVVYLSRYAGSGKGDKCAVNIKKYSFYHLSIEIT